MTRRRTRGVSSRCQNSPLDHHGLLGMGKVASPPCKYDFLHALSELLWLSYLPSQLDLARQREASV
jgi:hypothetical protein